MRKITLVRIPGPGASEVEINSTTTWQNLIDSYSLGGRQIVGQGAVISASSYNQVIGSHVTEVFATTNVKGN